MKKIDWKKVWNEYDKWLLSGEKVCNHCNHITFKFLSEEMQNEKIQSLVEQQLKPKRRK